jgi:membrane associated rhomboid family serine protease
MFLIGINILVFLAQQIFRNNYIDVYLGLSVLGIREGFFWQLITYMFAHGSISHVLFNMLALFLFGSALEHHVGSWEFLCYYLITGILAGAFSVLIYWLTGSYGVLLIGASGALFAIELAYATFFPNAMIYIWGIIPLRAPMMVIVFTVIELFNTITGSRDGVAHLTHLAGFAFGWFYFVIRFGFNPINSLFSRRR